MTAKLEAAKKAEWPPTKDLPTTCISEDTLLDIQNIAEGVFSPLTGFMNQKDYRSTVLKMHLASGQPWTIPITLDVDEPTSQKAAKADKLLLQTSAGVAVALLQVEDVYTINPAQDIPAVYGTSDTGHPGVRKEIARYPYRVGGALLQFYSPNPPPGAHHLSVNEVRRVILQKGWKTLVGFQTRNPPHRAHEYLHRVALELYDGLFIQPLIGWKKSGDFSPEAVLTSYQKLIQSFYQKEKVLLGSLRTAMRYAGPREAIFHAILRRNYGCTHFIIGRDHAGVGSFYSPYAAHELARQFPDLGIDILTLKGPYHCAKCNTIVTENTCPHGNSGVFNVNGSDIRKIISRGELPSAQYMRTEISEILTLLHKKNRAFL